MHPVRRFTLPLIAGLVLLACEPMDPSGNPFQPVSVPAAGSAGAGSATGGSAAGVGAPTTDPRFAGFDEEPQTFSSEEMKSLGSGKPAAGDSAAPAPAPAAAAAAPSAPTAPDGTPAVAPGPSAAPPAPVAAAYSTQLVAPMAPLGWAVRLVTTVPDAQPPRAILGLPDGQEIVVTPGAMVPDSGLVVLSIGAHAVQLARVQAAGDHATVQAFSLTPQY